jgi:hypothetical protein
MTCIAQHMYFAAIGDMPSRRCDDRSLLDQENCTLNHPGQTFIQRLQNSSPPWTNREDGIIADSDVASLFGDVR